MSNTNPYLTHHELQARWGGLDTKYILEFSRPTLIMGATVWRIGYNNKRDAIRRARQYARSGCACDVYDFHRPDMPINHR